VTDPGILLIQLPLHPGCAFEPTGNIPLAPGRIAAAGGLPADSVLSCTAADHWSDSEILSFVENARPSVIGFTLYMWNVERSVWLAGRIRRQVPGVFILGGGPEVSADNLWLRDAGAFDLLVAGEGEPFAERIGETSTLRETAGRLKGFLSTGRCSFPPDNWPDPYFTGHMESASDLPAHVETVRGCPHRCSYCSYRRICPDPREVPADRALRILRMHRDAGRTEVVFLDPTLNGRHDLPALLSGMKGLGLSCFGEVRAGTEDLDPAALAEAGFHSLEVGVQSLNRNALRALGRPDDPERTIRGALALKEAGVEPVLDLILGLPGDSPEGIVRAGERIRSLGLGENLQVFYLSVLPGTLLRTRAKKTGISHMNRPPYWVTSLPQFSMAHFSAAREELSSLLGYDLDMEPRPVLCDGWPGTGFLDLRLPSDPGIGGRHGVLRVTGGDVWSQRRRIVSAAAARFERDPYCVLDVVLETERPFPLDLISMLSEIPRPLDYHDRTAAILGRSGRLRTSVIVRGCADRGWLAACAGETVTVVPLPPGVAPTESSFEDRLGVLLQGFHDLAALSGSLPDYREQVFFRNIEMERLWCLDVLELG
jgi:hypothetical protein